MGRVGNGHRGMLGLREGRGRVPVGDGVVRACGGGRKRGRAVRDKRGLGSSDRAWSQLMVATDGPSRARGLLLRRRCSEPLILMPCNDVHTVGMVRKLDIAFVDRCGVVLESYRAVGPMRRLRCPRAVATIERFAECGTWFSEGDRVGLVAYAAQRERKGPAR